MDQRTDLYEHPHIQDFKILQVILVQISDKARNIYRLIDIDEGTRLRSGGDPKCQAGKIFGRSRYHGNLDSESRTPQLAPLFARVSRKVWPRRLSLRWAVSSSEVCSQCPPQSRHSSHSQAAKSTGILSAC